MIWNDGVAPEAALDFDAPHISRGQVRDGTPRPRAPFVRAAPPPHRRRSPLPPRAARRVKGLVMWLGGFAFFAGVFGFAYSLGHPANKISGDREIPPEGKEALGGYASGKW